MCHSSISQLMDQENMRLPFKPGIFHDYSELHPHQGEKRRGVGYRWDLLIYEYFEMASTLSGAYGNGNISVDPRRLTRARALF